MNKKILKNLIVSSLAVGVINFSPIILHENNLQIVSVAYAAVENVTASNSAMFDFGEDDSEIVETVKNVAKMRAIQSAKEKAGVYVKSFSKSINGILTDDDISAYTSINIEIINVTYQKKPGEMHDANGNPTGKIGYLYEATVTAKVDTSGLYEYIQRDYQSKSTLIDQNKNIKKYGEDINKNFDDLQKHTKNKNPEQIKFGLEKIDHKILEKEKYEDGQRKIDEATKLFAKKDYKGAISIYDELLELDPNFFNSTDYSSLFYKRSYFLIAYSNRGNAYYKLKKYKQAILDYNKAIETFEKSSLTYVERGKAYFNLKKYKQAISDFNQAIKYETEYVNSVQQHFGSSYTERILNIVYPEAYLFRGFSHFFEKNYNQAISDFTKSIEMDNYNSVPMINHAIVYHSRGITYQILRQNEKAKADFAKAKQLGYNG